MPLSIPLPAGAKIIINGAVIENSGTANISLTVHNKANILRDKDVVTASEADTLAKEIYHSIQNAYLFEANRDEWLRVSYMLLHQFETTRPDAAVMIGHVRELIEDDKLYNALRACRKLILLEGSAVPAAALATAEAPNAEPRQEGGRQREIIKIKDKIAELEKRISALDPE